MEATPRGRRLVLGWSVGLTLLFTVLWLFLFIYATVDQGAIESAEEARAYAEDSGLLHYLTYANAALVTVSATVLFGALYAYLRPQAPLLSAAGLAFVPAYTAFNLFAYVSQITIVPRLADAGPEFAPLLAQLVQAWPDSLVNVLNNLGYAVLGVPSVIFGLLLYRADRGMLVPGGLLTLSGLASVTGLVGIVLESSALSGGSVVGGALFLLALVALGVRLVWSPDWRGL